VLALAIISQIGSWSLTWALAALLLAGVGFVLAAVERMGCASRRARAIPPARCPRLPVFGRRIIT